MEGRGNKHLLAGVPEELEAIDVLGDVPEAEVLEDGRRDAVVVRRDDLAAVAPVYLKKGKQGVPDIGVSQEAEGTYDHRGRAWDARMTDLVSVVVFGVVGCCHHHAPGALEVLHSEGDKGSRDEVAEEVHWDALGESDGRRNLCVALGAVPSVVACVGVMKGG